MYLKISKLPLVAKRPGEMCNFNETFGTTSIIYLDLICMAYCLKFWFLSDDYGLVELVSLGMTVEVCKCQIALITPYYPRWLSCPKNLVRKLNNFFLRKQTIMLRQ